MFGTGHFYRRSCPLKFVCKGATWTNERMCARDSCLVTLCKYVQMKACKRGSRCPNERMTKDLCSRIHTPKRRMCARDGGLNRSLQHWESHFPKRKRLAGVKCVIERGPKGGFGLLNQRTSSGSFFPCELKLY